MVDLLAIAVDERAAGRDPDRLVRFDVLEHALEVPRPIRVPDEERMQSEAENPRNADALGVEHLELVHRDTVEVLTGRAVIQENRNITELESIGHGNERAAAGRQAIRQFIV